MLPSLLAVVQGLIERSCRLDPATVDPARFVIGDAGLVSLYGASVEAPGRARVLVRTDELSPRVTLYYPDRLIANLERHPPTLRICDENIADFATFIEELDHLLLVNAWARVGRSGRALELEVHANVVKVLVASLFLARTLRVARLGEGERLALRFQLLERGDYEGVEAAERGRYLDARRLSVRFLERLARASGVQRTALLHELTHAPFERQLRLCA